METASFELGKKAVFPQFLENQLNGVDVSLVWVLGVDKDVIKVNNDEDIKFLGHDFLNIALEVGRCVGQSKKHYLVLEVAVSSLKSRLIFIALFYPYPMVSTREVKLGKSFCLT